MSDDEYDRISRHFHGNDPGAPSCPQCKLEERERIVDLLLEKTQKWHEAGNGERVIALVSAIQLIQKDV